MRRAFSRGRNKEDTEMPEVKPLRWMGRLHATVFKVPGIGERFVRAQARFAANLAFHLPVLGSTKCTSLHELRGEWLKFLGMAGIFPSVSRESDTEFEMELDACPYGFSRQGDQGVCDACMDLDRAYVRLLGGEMEIVHNIPSGYPSCRFVIRMA